MNNKIKVLFIEDEESLQKSMGRALEFEGYELITAIDGETGIMLAKKEKPDLILLDLVLPKKDGFEVLKEIKNDDEIKKTPVIILSNLEGLGDVDKAIELGATNYLVKANYDLQELIDKIGSIIKPVKKQI